MDAKFVSEELRVTNENVYNINSIIYRLNVKLESDGRGQPSIWWVEAKVTHQAGYTDASGAKTTFVIRFTNYER